MTKTQRKENMKKERSEKGHVLIYGIPVKLSMEYDLYTCRHKHIHTFAVCRISNKLIQKDIKIIMEKFADGISSLHHNCTYRS